MTVSMILNLVAETVLQRADGMSAAELADYAEMLGAVAERRRGKIRFRFGRQRTDWLTLDHAREWLKGFADAVASGVR